MVLGYFKKVIYTASLIVPCKAHITGTLSNVPLL